ncbi:MAG: hypothetical protein U9N34_04365 [Candidatus Cloacimonadota bacterium]|nr:hypothetical protein [Candidatus Cloacimonadota bacterium]
MKIVEENTIIANEKLKERKANIVEQKTHEEKKAPQEYIAKMKQK